MRPIRSISVSMPIFQGARFLERVLGALAEQRIDLPWEFHACDCGSTDGTLAIFERRARDFPVPLRVHSIEGLEFNHADTRNLLATFSASDLLVFLTDDAIPVGTGWLAQLASNFADPRVGAAYCRNVPRPEADLLAQVFSQNDPSYASARRETELPPADVYARMSAAEKRVLYNYTDTASSVRRELWERHPYPRCAFGEDVLLARALLEAGYKVVFDEQAEVLHSHEYDARETRRRAADDARFNAEWLRRIPVASPRAIAWLRDRQLAEDAAALSASGLAGEALSAELARARELREAYYAGLYAGGQSARRFGRTRVLATPRVRVAFLDDPAAAEPVEAERAALAGALQAAGAEPAGRTEADVLHVRDARLERAELEALCGGRQIVVLELDERWEARAREDLLLLAALERADLAVARDASLARRFSAELGFDPARLAYAPPSSHASSHASSPQGSPPVSGAPRPRSADEAAAEWVFRYRGLLAKRAHDPCAPEWAAPAAHACALAGRARRASFEELELFVGSTAFFDVRGLGAGPREVWIACAAGAEPAAVRGRAALDGVPLGEIGPFDAFAGEAGAAAAAGGCERRLARLFTSWPAGAQRLSIEALPGQGPPARTNGRAQGVPPAALRLLRVELWSSARRLALATPGEIVWERAGGELARASGAARAELGSAVLGPGPGAAEYDLAGAGAGPRELALTAELAGAASFLVRVDGRRAARCVGPGAARRTYRARLVLPEGARRLRVEARGAGTLRLARLVLRAADSKPRDWRRALRGANRLLRSVALGPPFLEADS